MPPSDKTHADDDDDTDVDRLPETLDYRPNTPQSPSFVDQSSNTKTEFELSPVVALQHRDNLPVEFGNYTLQEVIGEGGAGIVFKATPNSKHEDGSSIETVAVKLIRPEMIASEKAALRFEKEARLHAEVDSPYVTRHFESGCEQGRYFIVSELVSGVGLDTIVDRFQKLPEKQSLRVIADVLKALSALHRVGVIHRDVKPGNVITCYGESSGDSDDVSLEHFEVAKLLDFGLARHVEQSESLAMTRQQAILGTPLYMAPEQNYESRSVDARADIYSVGVTLYQMLAGEPPFKSKEAVELADMHRVERPRPLNLVRKEISEALNNVVLKSLEKDPSLRYQDASEMLADVERILNDQPTSLRLYPETPNSTQRGVRSYDFEWTLDVTPKRMWPLVSDTDRFNEAIGLPAPKFTYDHSGPERKIFADANFNGMKVHWREHPFQWIHEREMSVLREFDSGPFEWVTSTVELHPLAGGRTRLIHRFQVKPRGWFGKLMTPFQFAFMTKRSLKKVYAKLETIANDTSCGYACDVAFSKPVQLTAAQKQALGERLESLSKSISNQHLVTEFGKLIRSVADPIAARLRPIPLSQKLDCSLEQSLETCMRAVEAGLLDMSWDVICPVCRIAASNTSSLERVQEHGHCDVCNLDFEVNFAKSVEVIFSVHPEIRPIELKTYCIGGPYHAPHVLAQNRLLPDQFVDIGVDLAAGNYQICGPQLANLPEVRVHDDAVANRAELSIGSSTETSLPDLQSGVSCVHIENRSESEILARFELASDRDEAVTAATIGQHSLFQQLFPGQINDAAALVDVSNVYLLAVKHLDAEGLIEKVGEVQVREFWATLQAICVSRASAEGGDCEVIECSHDSLLVSCGVLEDALQTLRVIIEEISAIGIPVDECCFAMNAGEIMIGSQASQPAAFGKSIRETRLWLAELQKQAVAISIGLQESIVSSETESSEWLANEFDLLDDSGSASFFQLRLKRSS